MSEVEILENPSMDQINEDAKKVDGILILHSTNQEDIDDIIRFYEDESDDFNVIYIHKYTEEGEKKETIFGMKRCF